MQEEQVDTVLFGMKRVLLRHTLDEKTRNSRLAQEACRILAAHGYHVSPENYEQLYSQRWERWSWRYGTVERDFTLFFFVETLLPKLGGEQEKCR